VDVPLEIVVGSVDEKFTALAMKMKARTRPGIARVLSVVGAGHNVLLERPDLLAHIVANGREAPLANGVTAL
jgi:pimeloyl-ACP methyl ester carboxylesterase